MLRQLFLKFLTGERSISLRKADPAPEELKARLRGVESIGLYLHIPFCEQICPYCPYNKEIFQGDLARQYVDALTTEMDLYSNLVGDRPVTPVYIGGGTPTTMLGRGLAELIAHLRAV